MARLRESFLRLEVVKTMEERFSVAAFMAAKKRGASLVRGDVTAYLREQAVLGCVKAIQSKILKSNSAETETVDSIQKHIEDSLEPTREQWKKYVKFITPYMVCLICALEDLLYLLNTLTFTTPIIIFPLTHLPSTPGLS